MAKIKVYHNPRCTKSRNSLKYLEDKGLDYETVEYLKEPLTFDELKKVIKLLGIKPEELLRKNEAEYKEFFKGKDLSDDEWIQVMIDYPKLMERPILVNNGKAVVARPTEKIDEILD